MRFLPKMYKKNIFEIDYKKLKKNGIKCLMFDLDNTICTKQYGKMDDEIINLFENLNKSFIVYIVSNNISNKRVKSFADIFGIKYYYWSAKPLTHNFRKIRKNNNLNKNEMCMIGDQLLTDILAANNYGCYSVLVDPLSKNDLKITKLNRLIENIIFKKYNKKKLMNKGDYYG